MYRFVSVFQTILFRILSLSTSKDRTKTTSEAGALPVRCHDIERDVYFVTQHAKPANLAVSLEVDRQKPKRDLRISCLYTRKVICLGFFKQSFPEFSLYSRVCGP
jgi:hypothetical protein